jgi:hypothetical protein
MEEPDIVSLNVAFTVALAGTSGWLAAGFVEVTVGGVVSAVAPVVKVQTLLAARALFARSVTPAVMVAVYVVALASGADGSKVAVVPESVTVPETGEFPAITVNVAVLTDLTASLKVAVTSALTATPVWLAPGFVEVTVGIVVSVTAAVAVLKVQTMFAARALLAMSVTPVVMVAVYNVSLASDTDGLKVAVVPESVTVPETGEFPAITVNVAVLTDLTASLKVAVTLAATATAVAFATGLVVFTVGRVVSVGGGGGGGGGVTAGLLLASPGKVLAVISAMLEYPSPSESAFSMAEKEWPAPPNAVA